MVRHVFIGRSTELRVNNEDDTSSEHVVMTQVLVDHLHLVLATCHHLFNLDHTFSMLLLHVSDFGQSHFDVFESLHSVVVERVAQC